MAKHQPKGFWLDRNNRRDWFTSFATQVGIDPDNVQDWEKVAKSQVVEHKVLTYPPIVALIDSLLVKGWRVHTRKL